MKLDSEQDIKLRKKKVLIVDDFFNFRLTMKNMVHSFGVIYCDDAGTGEEAIQKMAAREFDVILCDYNLGQGKSGQQVLEEGKFSGYISYSTVFIMVTAENTLDKIMGAMEYQPDDYLMKPFTKETLEKKIKTHIKKKEKLKDIQNNLAKKNYPEALRLCNDQIATSPSNLSELMKLKGEILLKKGAFKEALEFYDKVLLMGNIIWAAMGKGKTYLITGQYQEAKRIFENILAKNDKIMPAYDYLAKALQKINEHKEAQDVLMKALIISPLAILRQKDLGNIAYHNEDYSIAETCYKSVVEQGKYSCFKSPSDYTSLAKTLVQRDNSEEGLNILSGALKVFPEDNNARLHISIAESYVYKKMNNDTEARKAMDEAEKIVETIEGKIPADLGLEMARAYIIIGEEEKGAQIIKHIVQDNHDNSEILDNARMVFRETGMEDKGKKIIEDARQEIIRLNNEGVKLAQEGQMAEAIAYFEKATAHLPENKIINANAAQVLMLFMKENGTDERSLENVKTYLDRVRRIDESYKDLPMLLSMYDELISED